jgi:hypothetical protein
MRSFIFAILLLPLLVSKGMGQWSHEDDSIFYARTGKALKLRIDTIPLSRGPFISGHQTEYSGPRVAAAGKFFIGTPYVAGTLDLDTQQENLVIDLHGFDCVTFYENALALAATIHDAVCNSYTGVGSHPFTTPVPNEHTY